MMTVNNKVYTTIAGHYIIGGIIEIGLDTHIGNKRFKLPTDSDWRDLDVQDLWAFANSANEAKDVIVSVLDAVQSLPLIKSYAPVTHTWSSEPSKGGN